MKPLFKALQSMKYGGLSSAMSQHKDHFTPRMFHRLLAPSLAYSLGLAFAAMADAM